VVVPDSWIIFKHILPNIPLWTCSSFLTTLSFLGLGAQPIAELSTMLIDGKNYMFSAPWLVIFPSLVILIIVVLLTFLGNRIDVELNPRRSSRWESL